jgi:undecaprenyl-diphosphatase
LILIPKLFGWNDPGLAFDVFLHLGTLCAVFIYFSNDWFQLIRAGILSVVERRIGFERDRQMFWYLMFATIPAGLAGFFLKDFAETSFRDPLLIVVTLAFMGMLIYAIDNRSTSLKSMHDLTFREALWVGVAQGFALIPGVSRSGSTMSMARLQGFNRETAARFSFLLSFPITLAAVLFELKSLTEMGHLGLSTGYLFSGLIASFISGMATIHFLMGYLKNANFAIFAWYRILLATGSLIFLLARG